MPANCMQRITSWSAVIALGLSYTPAMRSITATVSPWPPSRAAAVAPTGPYPIIATSQSIGWAVRGNQAGGKRTAARSQTLFIGLQHELAEIARHLGEVPVAPAAGDGGRQRRQRA